MAFERAASLRDVPEGQAIVVEVDDQEVVLCNVKGEIYAVANLCTHDGGPLGEGRLFGDQIECPRHGARFDVRTGAVKALPAILPIPTYEVKGEGDEVFVDVE